MTPELTAHLDPSHRARDSFLPTVQEWLNDSGEVEGDDSPSELWDRAAYNSGGGGALVARRRGGVGNAIIGGCTDAGGDEDGSDRGGEVYSDSDRLIREIEIPAV